MTQVRYATLVALQEKLAKEKGLNLTLTSLMFEPNQAVLYQLVLPTGVAGWSSTFPLAVFTPEEVERHLQELV